MILPFRSERGVLSFIMIMDFSQQIAQYVITGLTIGAIYAIVAMGFNIIHNATMA